jgi:integrase
MAKAKRTKTRTPGVFKVGDRYEWISYRSGTSGTCDGYAEACDAKQTADKQGPTPERARGTFGEYAREWIDAYSGRTRRGFGEASRQRYREGLELYAIPFFDTVRQRRFADVKRPDMKAFVTWLERHEARDGRPLTASTIERTLAPLTAMYSDAIDDDLYIGRHPTDGVRANVRADAIDAEGDDNEKRAFTVEQVGRVLAAAGDGELMLRLLADTGIRWGELAEARGRDLKATKQGPVLAVRRAWDAKAKKVGRPKGWRAREVPLAPELARDLWRLQRGPNELLFRSPLGERLNYQNTLRRVLVPILRAASTPGDDLTWAAFHTFRHTFATLLVDAGANVKRVSKMLGHHKASFTLDYYAHLFDDDLGPTLSVGALVAGAGRGQVDGRETAGNDRKAGAIETAHLQA